MNNLPMNGCEILLNEIARIYRYNQDSVFNINTMAQQSQNDQLLIQNKVNNLNKNTNPPIQSIITPITVDSQPKSKIAQFFEAQTTAMSQQILNTKQQMKVTTQISPKHSQNSLSSLIDQEDGQLNNDDNESLSELPITTDIVPPDCVTKHLEIEKTKPPDTINNVKAIKSKSMTTGTALTSNDKANNKAKFRERNSEHMQSIKLIKNNFTNLFLSKKETPQTTTTTTTAQQTTTSNNDNNNELSKRDKLKTFLRSSLKNSETTKQSTENNQNDNELNDAKFKAPSIVIVSCNDNEQFNSANTLPTSHKRSLKAKNLFNFFDNDKQMQTQRQQRRLSDYHRPGKVNTILYIT
jgi:hypothetical protein